MLGVPAHQRIDRVAAPEAFGLVFLDELGRQPRQDRVHGGLCAARNLACTGTHFSRPRARFRGAGALFAEDWVCVGASAIVVAAF